MVVGKKIENFPNVLHRQKTNNQIIIFENKLWVGCLILTEGTHQGKKLSEPLGLDFIGIHIAGMVAFLSGPI